MLTSLTKQSNKVTVFLFCSSPPQLPPPPPAPPQQCPCSHLAAWGTCDPGMRAGRRRWGSGASATPACWCTGGPGPDPAPRRADTTWTAGRSPWWWSRGRWAPGGRVWDAWATRWPSSHPAWRGRWAGRLAAVPALAARSWTEASGSQSLPSPWLWRWCLPTRRVSSGDKITKNAAPFQVWTVRKFCSHNMEECCPILELYSPHSVALTTGQLSSEAP